MSCFHPISAYHKLGGGITWTYRESNGIKLTIKCGQCSGCKLENARQWAIRIKHEASMDSQNSFITLTYDNEHLPPTGTLVLEDWQKFMRRLRKSQPHKKLSFYHCGEYGEKQGRPHYHAIIFNHQFSDLIPIPRKKDLHTSETLKTLWGKGHISVGSVTFESASYVASYVQKKINGPKAEAINMSNGLRHYERMTREGEVITLKKEYATMSRRPGIASLWFAKHHTDIYPSDFVTHKGKKESLPKYYDTQYEILTQDNKDLIPMDLILEKRQAKMKKLAHLFTPEALKQKEVHHKAKMALYKRNTL
jgi:hypothetical protein